MRQNLPLCGNGLTKTINTFFKKKTLFSKAFGDWKKRVNRQKKTLFSKAFGDWKKRVNRQKKTLFSKAFGDWKKRVNRQKKHYLAKHSVIGKRE